MAGWEEVEITQISVKELRADPSGSVVEQIAALAYQAFREPPWTESLEGPRLHFGLGVDLTRRGAVAHIAKTRDSNKIIGYLLGYEVLRESKDPRDLTLSEISGSDALDYLFEGEKRVFYGDTLCVAPGFRRQHIAERLFMALIQVLREEGFTYHLGDTDITAKAPRGLFTKLGFQELPVHNIFYPQRTYWLLRL